MPFPFYRLHCDLQYRLRDLVTPSELCQLQLALEDTQVYVYKIGDEVVLKNTVTHAGYDVKNEIVFVDNLVVGSIMVFDSLRTYAVLILKKLKFYCNVDLPLLKKYAPYCSKDAFVELKFDGYLMDVSMQLLFTLFPNLKKLEIPVYHMKNWLHDLVEIKANGLEILLIKLHASDEIEDVFRDRMFCNINAIELFLFCKAQQPGFQLRLEFDTKERLGPAIWDFLKPYFRPVKNDNDVAKIVIKNQWDDEYHACFTSESMSVEPMEQDGHQIADVGREREENTEFSLIRQLDSNLLKLFDVDAEDYVETTT
uniref:FTH domain-containing protein n=1 Tax=Panagrellus redivivus TaxID=6233 RepID=A0A7E4UWL9_PANRE